MPAPASSALSRKKPDSMVRVILGSATGTMIEWYDFYIFGSLTAVLAIKFYPPGNDTFALIAYLATFAVGFLVRRSALSSLAGSATWWVEESLSSLPSPSWAPLLHPSVCCPLSNPLDGFLPSPSS